MSTLLPPSIDPTLDPTLDPSLAPPPPQEELVGNLPKELADAIQTVVDEFDQHERPFRDIFVRYYKRNELFWDGYQYLFWSDTAHDWQGPQLISRDIQDPELIQDLSNFTKTINIYRAHGQSIIGALSTGLPQVRWYPEDSDNPEDITTAKTYGKISEHIERQNHTEMLFIKALYFLWNFGWCGAYTTHHADFKYGQVKVPIFGKQEQLISQSVCPLCQSELPGAGPESEEDSSNDLTIETDSLEEDILPNDLNEEFQNQNQDPTQVCPNCQESIVPQVMQGLESVPTVKEHVNVPKGQQKIELYGPLNLKISHSARRQEDVGVLILEDEYHYAQMRAIYPEHKEDIQPTTNLENYDRWARHLGNDVLQNLATCRRIWIRPWMFETLEDDDLINKLKEKFPQGVYAVFINANFIEAYNEDLDDAWTLTVSPTATTIHEEPDGKPLIPIQEIVNELFNLELQTIQYGIPETFADQKVLDFDKYKQSQNDVGMVYPIQNPYPDQPISNSFYTLKTATLSKEIESFKQQLDEAGQFVVSSFPSIYGGPASSSSSKTLGEYEQSRNQALQRLSLRWKMLNNWYPMVMSKAVKGYIQNLLEDEKYTKYEGSNPITVWIKREEMAGKVGLADSETSEQFPISWAQKSAMIFKLMGLNDPRVGEIFFSDPENIGFMSRMFGLTELHIPGEDDRNKQLREISDILKGLPVQVDPNVDNHQIEATVCRDWLVSDKGLDCKTNNPQGYMMVMQHMMQHNQIIQQQQMAEDARQMQLNAQAAGSGAGAGKNTQNSEKPAAS